MPPPGLPEAAAAPSPTPTPPANAPIQLMPPGLAAGAPAPTPIGEAAIRSGAIVPLPPPRPTPGATRASFGLDVGGAPDLAAARQVWSGLLSARGALIASLQPIASRRPGANGASELRVVLGPFADAADAASACARLQALGTACVPTLFIGDPLTP